MAASCSIGANVPTHRKLRPAAAFERLLGLAATLEPASYQMLISRS